MRVKVFIPHKRKKVIYESITNSFEFCQLLSDVVGAEAAERKFINQKISFNWKMFPNNEKKTN